MLQLERSFAKQRRALCAVLSSKAFMWSLVSELHHHPCVRHSPQEAPQPVVEASEKISLMNFPDLILLACQGFEKTLIHYLRSPLRREGILIIAE